MTTPTFEVEWKPYKPGDEVPLGQYWIALDYEQFGRRYRSVEVGERLYSKPHPIFRCDDTGGCDSYVTHYAPLTWPALPETT